MRAHIGGLGRLAAVALASAALVGTAPPAAAHGPGSNGCTLSPDAVAAAIRYDFHAACDRHDVCYDDLWFGRGVYDLLNGGWTGRLACDEAFLRDMRSSCRSLHGSNWLPRKACEAIAGVYYVAVRAHGARFFDNPDLN